MENNVDFGFYFEDIYDSSFCKQKPLSCFIWLEVFII